MRHRIPPNEANLQELKDIGCSYEKCLDFLGLYIKLIREHLESDSKEFSKKMFILGYSEQFVRNCMAQLSQLQSERPVVFDQLTSFKWRLDISFFNKYVVYSTTCKCV